MIYSSNLREKLSILSRGHTDPVGHFLKSLMILQKPSHYCTSCANPCRLRRYVESIVDELAVTNFRCHVLQKMRTMYSFALITVGIVCVPVLWEVETGYI